MKTRSGHLFKRNHIFYVQWRIDGKLYMKSTGKRNKGDADIERAKIMAPFILGDKAATLQNIADKIGNLNTEIAHIEDERTAALKLSEAWNKYESAGNRPDSGPRTLEGYASQFARFEKWTTVRHPAIKELRQVDAKTANEYAADLKAAKLSPSTYNQHVKTLDLVWSVLREPGKIEINPWAWNKKSKTGMARMNLKKQKKARRKTALTLEQIESLLVVAPGDYRDLLTLLAYTGQRLIDMVMLEWDAVDFRKRVITLSPRKTEGTKEENDVFIPLLPAAESVLLQRKQSDRYVFPALVEEYERDNGSAMVKKIGAIFEAAGMTRHKENESGGRAVVAYGAHSFRHGFVTIARSHGIPDAVISRITGHTTAEMLDHYSQFDKALAGALATKALQAASVEREPRKAFPSREPLPDWAIKVIKGMTAKTWRKSQSEMLALAEG